MRRNQERNLALHRSVFAHLTRAVPDPDNPERRISYDELEQRLRGRIYRRTVQTDRSSAEA